MTYIVVYLRHSDEVIRVRTGSTCECHSQFTQEKGLAIRGFELAHRPLSHLPAPSVPLPPAGSNHPVTSACPRKEGGLYGQAFHSFNQASPTAGATAAFHHQPVGGPGLAPASQTTRGTWLNGEASQNSVVTINMCLIVWRLKKSLKFTTGWCRRWKQVRTKSPPN